MEYIFIVVLGVLLFRVSQRVEKLEEDVRILAKRVYSSQAEDTTVMSDAPVAVPSTPLYTDETFSEPVVATAAIDSVGQSAFLAWIQKDFLVKLGALLVILPVGWFMALMFENGVIGPVGQISIGILAGVAFMGLGFKRSLRFPHQGGIFTVLGSTIVLIAVYAARELYGLFTPLTALVVMSMSVLFVSYVAVFYKSSNLAVASVLLGAVAPFLTAAEAGSTLMLFSYLTLLVLGSLWILTQITSPYLQLVTLGVVYLYSLPYLSDSPSVADTSLVLVFAFLYTFVFFVSVLFSLLTREQDKSTGAEIAVAAGTAMYVAMWIHEAVSPDWQALQFTAWAVVFAVGAYLLFVQTNKTAAFYLYGAVALGFLAAATAAILEGPALLIALTAEITVLVVVAAEYVGLRVASGVSLLYFFPVSFALASFSSSAWQYGVVLHEDFAVIVCVIAGLLFGAWALYKCAGREEKTTSTAAIVLATVAGANILGLIWQTAHALLPYDRAVTVALVIYMIVGVPSYIEGVSRTNKLLRYIGVVLIGIVVAHLLLVDVWQMETTGRIITFLLVGVLLLSTAFSKKLQNK